MKCDNIFAGYEVKTLNKEELLEYIELIEKIKARIDVL